METDLMNDAHLSSKADFFRYYYAIKRNDVDMAISILRNNPSLANQIVNAEIINKLQLGVINLEGLFVGNVQTYMEFLTKKMTESANNIKKIGNWFHDVWYEKYNFVIDNGVLYFAIQRNKDKRPSKLSAEWIEIGAQGEKGFARYKLTI